jgi:hypothetical protein
MGAEGATDMNQEYKYQAQICTRCGAKVWDNWYLRHRRSGCKRGIIEPAPVQQVDQADGVNPMSYSDYVEEKITGGLD